MFSPRNTLESLSIPTSRSPPISIATCPLRTSSASSCGGPRRNGISITFQPAFACRFLWKWFKFKSPERRALLAPAGHSEGAGSSVERTHIGWDGGRLEKAQRD